MALCKHCQVESTLSAVEGETCPNCGMPFEFSDDDWDLDEAVEARGSGPDETAREIEQSVGEETEVFGGAAEPEATAPAGPADSDNLAGREAAVDMTHAFGGKFADESWDEIEDIALGEEDEDLTAGPGDVTAPYVDPEGSSAGDSSAGGGSGTAREATPDTDRLNPDATIAFDSGRPGDPSSGGPSTDAGAGTGADPGFGQTVGLGAPAPPAAGPADPGPPASGAAPPDSAAAFGTLPAGLSGSDRGSDRPPSSTGDDPRTRGEEVGSHGGDSGTLAVDSDRRSDRVETPKPREITGLESGQTIPRGVMGDDRASQSLRPGDTHVIGPENVRLRAYRLGADEKRGPNDFQVEVGPFAGGMGVVHGMRQASLDRRVAVKQVKPEMSANESDRNKFISEAVITGQLEHPNIIPVHDLGLASDGLPFYSMKFVERTEVDPKTGKPKGIEWEDNIKQLSEEENLSILIQVSQAIAFAHSRGIIHRDLKPGNIALGDYGEVLVMDWGLAARLENAEEIPPSGTPVYMPPETALQYLDYAKGKSGGKPSGTRRIPAGTYSDIYLLGGLLFKIATGRAPHRGKTTFECLKAAARNEIVKTSKRSELLDIAYKAMRTDPGERHRDVGEFIDEIRAYQAHAQSNKIAKQANADLKAAEKAKEDRAVDTNLTYASYSSAQHGFRNALDLWEGNRRAAKRLVETKRRYAETAYGNGDYDLALSLLDAESNDDAGLIDEVRSAQRQRSRKLQVFRTLQYGMAASLVVAVGALIVTGVFGYDAMTQRRVAAEERRSAAAAKGEAEQAKTDAQFAKKEANDQLAKANAFRKEAAEAQGKADMANERLGAANTKLKEADAKLGLANTRLAEANRKADGAIEAQKKAEGLATEFQAAAEEQRYAAVLNGVRSTLAERGQFAAWAKLRAEYGPERDPALRARGREWRDLLRDVDWRRDGREAEEVRKGLAAPLVAVSRGGRVAVVIDNRDDAPRLSVFRGGDFGAAVAEWPLDAVARSLAVSADGRVLAVVGDRLSLYRVDGARIAIRDGAGLPVTAVAFDPAGGLLTGDAETGVARWTVDTDNAVASLASRQDEWHPQPISAVGFSPDGGLRFAADAGGRVTVWRGEGATAERWAFSHASASTGSPVITAAAIADRADGGTLAYGCKDGAVYVLHGPWTGEQDGEQQDGERGPAVGLISLTSAATGARRSMPGWIRERPDKLNTPHTSAVTSVAFAEGGRVVVSTGGSRALVRNAAADSKRVVKPVREYHDSGILSAALADGWAHTTDEAGRLVRWSIATEPNPARLEPGPGEPRGPVVAIGVDPEKPAVVVGDRLGFLRRWDRPFVSREHEKRFAGHADHRRMRAWVVGGSTPRVVTVGADRLACVWDAATGELRRTLDLGGRRVVALSADRDALLAATDQPTGDGASAVASPLDGAEAVPLWTDSPRVSALHAFRRAGESEPTTAVGLRDGQLYLWTPSRGRVRLVSSTSRPHWRRIRAIGYDADPDALFAVDNAGLLTRWSLPNGRVAEAFLPGGGAPRRIEVSSGRLLIVRDRLDGATVQLADAGTLRPITPPGFARTDLRDAAFTAGGDVLAVAANGRLLAWSEGAWSTAGADEAIAGAGGRRGAWTGVLSAPGGGVLLFGDGHAELWSGHGRDARLVSRITSRTRPVAVTPGPDGAVFAASGQGWLDVWGPARAGRLAPRQLGVGVGSPVIAACSAGPGRLFAVDADGDGGARVRLRNLATGDRLGESYRVGSGRVTAVDANDDWLAVAVAEPGDHRVELFRRADGVRAAIRFGAPPRAVAVGSSGDRLAVLQGDRVAYAARDAAGGGWTVGVLDRDAVSAVAFSPGGGRLLVGHEAGQIAMLAVGPAGGDGPRFAGREVLTFGGHSDAVSVLRYVTLDGQPALVSGDRSGTVLVKRL